MVLLSNNYDGDILIDTEKIAGRVVEGALDYENCPYDCRVSLTLIGNDEIKDVNHHFRGIDRATDVLSFPAADYPVPGDFSDIETRDPFAFDPESGELILGDIMISMDKVKEQAMEYGHSEIREFAFLVAHSMLHLMGYDHMTDRERQIMEEKQECILHHLGYDRESDAEDDKG